MRTIKKILVDKKEIIELVERRYNIKLKFAELIQDKGLIGEINES